MSSMKAIAFTDVGKADLIDWEKPALGPDDVCVRMQYTAVSAGTERANLLDLPNIPHVPYPRFLGYSGVGFVTETGENAHKFQKGDRVLVYHGHHWQYNVVKEDQLTKVTDDCIDAREAAFVVIAVMGLGGVRKLELEIGESAMVMGQGVLGVCATQYLALSGANPLIAVDFDEKRLETAKKFGADYTFSPGDPNFVEQVKKVTGGKGVNAIVEVTGSSAAMAQALACASWMGRVSLLGCTRVSDCPVDYYTQVHRPGVKLIGAHNFVRPKMESYPHHWTHQDDCKCTLDLISAGKFHILPLISTIARPSESAQIYQRLVENRLELGVLFDWDQL